MPSRFLYYSLLAITTAMDVLLQAFTAVSGSLSGSLSAGHSAEGSCTAINRWNSSEFLPSSEMVLARAVRLKKIKKMSLSLHL